MKPQYLRAGREHPRLDQTNENSHVSFGLVLEVRKNDRFVEPDITGPSTFCSQVAKLASLRARLRNVVAGIVEVAASIRCSGSCLTPRARDSLAIWFPRCACSIDGIHLRRRRSFCRVRGPALGLRFRPDVVSTLIGFILKGIEP